MKRVPLALLVLAAAPVATPLAAQSLLYRPPNLSGTWVADVGVVQFNFLHRFHVSQSPVNEVQNFPTFTLATGLGHGLGLGWHFGTNSFVGPGRLDNNESEWFVRWRARGAEGRSGFSVAVTAAYNELAQSGDGEIGVDYTLRRLTLSGAVRGMTHPFREPDAKAALAGGAVVRLTNYIAVSADIGSRVNPTTRAAWSAAINFLIPSSPHTFSLQASNAATSTIQGNSQGLLSFDGSGSNQILYGFEFTIPLHLKRFRCNGIVNSKPYRIWFEPEPSKLSKPCEFPWIVLVAALLAWSENVWGELGMRKLIAALQAARVVGLTRDPMSALTAM